MLKITLQKGPCVENYMKDLITLGDLTIANDGTGGGTVGNYIIHPHRTQEALNDEYFIKNHNRSESVWRLVVKGLNQAKSFNQVLHEQELLWVTIDLYPYGVETLRKQIGTLAIANAGTDLLYDYTEKTITGDSLHRNGEKLLNNSNITVTQAVTEVL